MRYTSHIFVCTNQRADTAKKSCGEDCGKALIERLKEEIKIQQLEGRIRIQASGCLGACSKGPAMVVYPEGVFYGDLTPDDIPSIVTQHLLQGNPLEEKRIFQEFDI